MDRVTLRDNLACRLGRPHPQEPKVRLHRHPLRLLYDRLIDFSKGLKVLSQVLVGDAGRKAAEKELRRRALRQIWRSDCQDHGVDVSGAERSVEFSGLRTREGSLLLSLTLVRGVRYGPDYRFGGLCVCF